MALMALVILLQYITVDDVVSITALNIKAKH